MVDKRDKIIAQLHRYEIYDVKDWNIESRKSDLSRALSRETLDLNIRGFFKD